MKNAQKHVMEEFWNFTVKPILTDTPEMRSSTVMRTLCLVPNYASIHWYINENTETCKPPYSVMRTVFTTPRVR